MMLTALMLPTKKAGKWFSGSPDLRLCARGLHNLQASADQLRRRSSAAHRSVGAGGRSSAITSRTASLEPGARRQGKGSQRANRADRERQRRGSRPATEGRLFQRRAGISL